MSSSAGRRCPARNAARRLGRCRKSDAIRSCRVQRPHEGCPRTQTVRDPRNSSPFMGFASGKRSLIMKSLKVLSAAAAVALVLPLATPSFAQGRGGHGGGGGGHWRRRRRRSLRRRWRVTSAVAARAWAAAISAARGSAAAVVTSRPVQLCVPAAARLWRRRPQLRSRGQQLAWRRRQLARRRLASSRRRLLARCRGGCCDRRPRLLRLLRRPAITTTPTTMATTAIMMSRQ